MLPLTTDRLIVRKFNLHDSRDLFEYLSLRSTYTYEPGSPITMEEAQNVAEQRSQTTDFLAVELKTQHKMIGHLFLAQTGPKDFMTYELGYIFNPSFHNRGYASEAANAAISYCFTALKAHRIVANCNPQNAASWKVLEHCGMTREACFRKNVYFRTDPDGVPVWMDTFQYAILSTDFGTSG